MSLQAIIEAKIVKSPRHSVFGGGPQTDVTPDVWVVDAEDKYESDAIRSLMGVVEHQEGVLACPTNDRKRRRMSDRCCLPRNLRTCALELVHELRILFVTSP